MLKKCIYIIVGLAVIYTGLWFSIAAVARINVRQMVDWEYASKQMPKPQISTSGFPHQFVFTITQQAAEKKADTTSVSSVAHNSTIVTMGPLLSQATVQYPDRHDYTIKRKITGQEDQSEVFHIDHKGNVTANIVFRHSLWWEMFKHTDHASLINNIAFIHTDMSNDHWQGSGVDVAPLSSTTVHTSHVVWRDDEKPSLVIDADFQPMNISFPQSLVSGLSSTTVGDALLSMLLVHEQPVTTGKLSIHTEVGFDEGTQLFDVLDQMFWGRGKALSPSLKAYHLNAVDMPLFHALDASLADDVFTLNATIAGNSTVPQSFQGLKNDVLTVVVNNVPHDVDFIHPLSNAHPYDSFTDFGAHVEWLTDLLVTQGTLKRLGMVTTKAENNTGPGAFLFDQDTKVLTVGNPIEWAAILKEGAARVGKSCESKDLEQWLLPFSKTDKKSVAQWPSCFTE